MKKTVLLALLVFMFTIACKKDKTTPQPKVKTKTTGGVTETYTYDEQGRLKVTYVSSSTYHDSIIYRTDSLLHYSVSSSGVATFSYALPLNAQGLVKGSYGLIRSESYFYNSDGFKTLTLISDILSSEKDTNHISNNNIIKNEIQSSGILTSSSTVSNFTFSDKTNSLTAESLGLQVFGKLNKNLISTSVVTYTAGCFFPPCPSPTVTNYNYTYEFDANGWVTKQTITNVGTSATSVTSYTYY